MLCQIAVNDSITVLTHWRSIKIFLTFYVLLIFFFPYSRVQLNRRFGSSSDFNLLDKLLESLRARVASNSSGNREAFVNRIKEGIAENIKPQPAIQQCETIVESFQQD